MRPGGRHGALERGGTAGADAGAGHAAKSIAGLTGASVGAVNERLRAARRKTGAASSRALARAVAQESGDGFFGLAAPPPAAPAPARAADPRRWRMPLMTALLAAAATAALLHPAAPLALPPDPATAAFTGAAQPPDFAALRRRLVEEPRDPAWAPATEAAATAAYRARLAPGAMVRATCGRTLCEAAGDLPAMDAAANRDLAALQGAPLRAALAPLGLADPQSVFGGATADRPGRTPFLQYWRRMGRSR